MASVSRPPPPQLHQYYHMMIHWSSSSSSFYKTTARYHGMPRVRAVKIPVAGGSDQVVYGPDLLIRKPVVSQASDHKDGSLPMDWEDKILMETVPLVGFVRMILHSAKYKSGDRLSPDHEKIIVERLLPFHPKYEKKIGSGIDHILVGYHSKFKETRCLLVAQKDGELIDFSYRKCIKGLIRNKYPLHADAFIVRRFRRYRLKN
ncbi:hypothetical protein Ddye_010526 [Dipteronia dyeriana]|uniref:Uncharacterized protein n=1 Tax=Dipteronia dyeriana TaxID=168575 RepID=A0AAE0CNE7_9ROSI|nr:hypothetical protein Ddye_010526 [Dipteronia dyeriana]